MCEWTSTKVVGAAGKDSTFFKLIPEAGTLQPGERANVTVTYTPNEARPFAMKIPLKVNHNPNKYVSWVTATLGWTMGVGYCCLRVTSDRLSD